MSTSSHVHGYGFDPARTSLEEWRQMKDVYDACVRARVPIPEMVLEYFDYDSPNERGVMLNVEPALRPYETATRRGFEVDLSKLPDGVEVLRFFNTW